MSEEKRIYREFRKYIIYHYGNLISCSQPKFYKPKRYWISNIICGYPNIIRDSNNNPVDLKINMYNNLGVLVFDDNLFLVKASSPEVVEKRLERLIDNTKEKKLI